MKSSHQKNKTLKDKISLVTRDDLFLGLPFDLRVENCIKIIEGIAHQFLNETSILLDLARNGASVYVSCEAENDTDICAFLAQLDMEVEEVAIETQNKLKELQHNI